jgi:hypothetical protein
VLSYGVDISRDWTIALVCDTYNHQIMYIKIADGTMTRVAGTDSMVVNDGRGFVDGTGTTAKLDLPWMVSISSDMTFALFVDSGNNKVRLYVGIHSCS